MRNRNCHHRPSMHKKHFAKLKADKDMIKADIQQLMEKRDKLMENTKRFNLRKNDEEVKGAL